MPIRSSLSGRTGRMMPASTSVLAVCRRRVIGSMPGVSHTPSPLRTHGQCDTIDRMSRWFQRFGFQQVLDGLLVGAYPKDADDVDEIAQACVDVVYNLCEDAEYARGERDAVARALG